MGKTIGIQLSSHNCPSAAKQLSDQSNSSAEGAPLRHPSTMLSTPQKPHRRPITKVEPWCATSGEHIDTLRGTPIRSRRKYHEAPPPSRASSRATSLRGRSSSLFRTYGSPSTHPIFPFNHHQLDLLDLLHITIPRKRRRTLQHRASPLKYWASSLAFI